jgi:hypothetical protein
LTNRILAVNNHALNAIQSGMDRNQSVSLIPWAPFVDLDHVVTQSFADVMSVLEVTMGRLIIQTGLSHQNLTNLEERLSSLYAVVVRVDNSTSLAKSELLSGLWARLGGHKRIVQKFDERLYLLKELGLYRRQALAHVVVALESLQQMSADMEDLRDRAAVAELAPGRIAVEVHINSINNGLLRLQEMKLSARRVKQAEMRKQLTGGV